MCFRNVLRAVLADRKHELGRGADTFNFAYDFKFKYLTVVAQCDVLLVPGLVLLYGCALTDAPRPFWIVGMYIMLAALFFSVGKGPFGSFGEGPLLVASIHLAITVAIHCVLYFS